MNPIVHTSRIVATECCQCHRPFGLLESYMAHAKAVGRFEIQHFCPYCGTKQGWGTGEMQRLQKDLERISKERDLLAQKRREALAEAEHFRKSRNGMKGQLVRVKNRVSKGVCPCCNRYFANLHRHMETQHPHHTETTP